MTMKPIVYEARDGQTITLDFQTIKKFLVQGHPEWVIDKEMVFFMGVCKSKGLNPFIRDCYLMKYSQHDNAAIIISRGYKRKRAKAQADCAGWSSGIIVSRNNTIVYSNGLMLPDDILLGGWFRAKPKGWDEPMELEVNLSTYLKHKQDGSLTKFWAKEKQPMMIQKVAESQGLTACWPGEFSDMYIEEEIGQASMFKDTEKLGKEAISEEKLSTEELEAKVLAKKPKAEKTEALPPESDSGMQDSPASPVSEDNSRIVDTEINWIEWLTACRPSTSLRNAKEALKTFKEQFEAIANLKDSKLRHQLERKFAKTQEYIKSKESAPPPTKETNALPLKTEEHLPWNKNQETAPEILTDAEKEKRKRKSDFAAWAKAAEDLYLEKVGDSVIGLALNVLGLKNFEDICDVDIPAVKKRIRLECQAADIVLPGATPNG